MVVCIQIGVLAFNAVFPPQTTSAATSIGVVNAASNVKWSRRLERMMDASYARLGSWLAAGRCPEDSSCSTYRLQGLWKSTS